MATCRICATLRRWLGIGEEVSCDALWQAHVDESETWERAHSNHDELWWRDTDRNRTLIGDAWSCRDADPAAAFALLVEAAEAGSPWAMESVASHYHHGTVVAADFDKAADHYHRAICAGSWLATIGYARLLAEHGHADESEAVLRDGVALDFIPAFFWLAWLRYERAPTRTTGREIRPLLHHAAGQGHPGAKDMLGRLMMTGKFGILAIPRGLRLLYETMPPIPSRDEAAPAHPRKRKALKAAAQE